MAFAPIPRESRTIKKTLLYPFIFTSISAQLYLNLVAVAHKQVCRCLTYCFLTPDCATRSIAARMLPSGQIFRAKAYIGAMPDSHRFGDAGADTFGHILEKMGTLDIPNLRKLGLLNLHPQKISLIFPTPITSRPASFKAFSTVGPVGFKA